MDNPAAPIPSISPQLEVSPTESPNRRWLLWLAGGLFMLIIGIAIGFFSAKLSNQPSTQPPGNFLPASNSESATPTPLPSEASAGVDDPTANWKTYTHPTLGYSFLYPESMSIEVYNNSTLVRIDPPDPRMIVGICPRWISFSAVDSSSSTKKTRDEYKCVNDAFILEEKIFVESQYREGNQKIIDQILSTFKFLD